MDFTLDVLILKKDICSVGLNKQLITWGDEEFSQEPPRYTNDSKLFFERSGNLEYYKEYFNKFIPDNIAIDEFEALRLIGNNMFELERLINYKQEPIKNLLNNEVIVFLSRLSKLDSFVIFLIRDEEYIDGQYRLQNDSELVNIIYDCISYSISRGLVITKKNI
jgi:hypothetical protein